MNLVIVESPAKAKTINKYLGDNYTVLASYGHIRDLPSKNGSVDPEQNFKMEWEVDSFSKKYLKEITDAAKGSSKIILATDPDREGEAIAADIASEIRGDIERVEFTVTFPLALKIDDPLWISTFVRIYCAGFIWEATVLFKINSYSLAS